MKEFLCYIYIMVTAASFVGVIAIPYILGRIAALALCLLAVATLAAMEGY